MTNILPEPQVFQRFCEGSYLKDSTDFIKNEIKGAEVVAQKVINTWKVDVIKYEGRLYAAFRGSENMGNWVENIERLIHDPTDTVNKMNKFLSGCESKFQCKLL